LSQFLSRNEFFTIFEVQVEHFFRNFWKVWNFWIPKLYELFQTFSKLYELFRTFWPKTGFFPLVFKFYIVFLKFSILFWLISELFSKLKFPNFFQTFLRKFCEFKNSGYFRKISKLQKSNFSETRENKKFRNFRLKQGLTEYGPHRSHLAFRVVFMLLKKECNFQVLLVYRMWPEGPKNLKWLANQKMSTTAITE